MDLVNEMLGLLAFALLFVYLCVGDAGTEYDHYFKPWGNPRDVIMLATSFYPAVLCWGNSLWATVFFRMQYPNKETDRLFSLLFSYACCAMPGNIFTNLLCLNRTPSAFTSAEMFRTHVLAWALVNASPFDIVYRILSTKPAFTALDTIGVVDNMATALAWMMLATQQSWASSTHGEVVEPIQHAVFTGVVVNLSGRVVRYFYAYTEKDNVVSFDEAFGPALRMSLLCCSSFYFLVLQNSQSVSGGGTLVHCNFSTGKIDRTRCAVETPYFWAITWFAAICSCCPIVGTLLNFDKGALGWVWSVVVELVRLVRRLGAMDNAQSKSSEVATAKVAMATKQKKAQ